MPFLGTRRFHWVVARSGIPWIIRELVQRNRPTVMCCHNPSPDALRAQIRFLRSRYTLVPLRQIVRWLVGEAHTLPRKALAITLDDGWAGNALLADVFRDEGVTPTIFVCTQVVGRARRFWWEHLRPEEVQELKRLDDDARIATLAAAGHPELSEGSTEPSALTLDDLRAATEWADVQSHTRLHPILPRCDDDRAWSEIAGSRDDLLAITGSEVYALAYPNGDCGSREMEMARSAGYLCALTVDARFISRRDNPYKIPRIAVQDSATRDELTAKLCGLHDLVRRALSPHRPEAGSRRGWLRPDT